MSHDYYAFEGPIERHGVGRSRVIWYNVLFLPPDLDASLPKPARPLRIDGEIADLPVAGAWMPAGDGRRYFMVSPRILRAAELHVGQSVEMRFRLDDPNRVDVPDALTAALARSDAARVAFEAMTPGRRRALCHYVAEARTVPTEIRRIADVLAFIAAGETDLRRLRPKPAR
jgi:hypothetical protein